MSTSNDRDKTHAQPRQSFGPLVGISLVAIGVIVLLERFGLRIAWREVLSAGLIVIGVGVIATARRGVPSWLVSAGVVVGIVLLLVTAGGLTLAGGFGPIEERSTTLQFDEPIHALDVEVAAGVVDLVGGADSVRAERSVEFRGREPRITEEIEDGVLRVRVECAPALFRSACRASYRFQAPRDIDVEVSTGSGSVRLTDITGSVHAETGSGRIDLHRIAGEVDVETGAGGIGGEQLESPRFAGDTGSGAIDLHFARPPDLLEIETGSGGVNVRVPEDRYELDLDTGSGTTSTTGITEDANAPMRIEIDTGSGAIMVQGEPSR